MLSLTLVACHGTEVAGNAPESYVDVYVSAKAIQCEYSGDSAEKTAKVLIDADVAVKTSQCASMTDVMFPAVCGGGSGEINIHTIATGDLPKAKAAGFAPVSELRAGKTKGYVVGDCSGRGVRTDSSI